jgi:t-SNARE complex subunit (syntaxin)
MSEEKTMMAAKLLTEIADRTIKSLQDKNAELELALSEKMVSDINFMTSITALRNQVSSLEDELSQIRSEHRIMTNERNQFQDQCISMKIKHHLAGEAS